MMIMIGTGHVFNIAEPISFIIKNYWPDAVLVEIDELRYNSLMSPKGEIEITTDMPKVYRKAAKTQRAMSKENGVESGGDMLAAIGSGKLVGAEIICIDKDIEQVMREWEDEMSLIERVRMSMSSFSADHLPRRKVDSAHKDYSVHEREYTENMRRRFPTLVRKLIDERNDYMVDRIRDAAERFDRIVVVVGDAHVEGICKGLADPSIRKIRLAELLDTESMGHIRNRIWNGEWTEKCRDES